MNTETDKYLDFAYSLVRIRDLDELMELMLKKLRSLLNADAGSVYIYSKEDNCLIFKYTQNDTVCVPFKEFSLPLTESSIAGYCGLKREIVRIDDVRDIGDFPFSFNADYDIISGYQTKSVMVIPLANSKGELVGVLQLINKLKNEQTKPAGYSKNQIIPFTQKDESVSHSLSGIMAISLENSILYENIEQMWEGFIKASIQAIEARDPVTKGHTERVTALSMAFAGKLSEDTEDFKDFEMDRETSKMFKYACLLHDFGKIGVRENVLNKSEKLYPWQLDVIKWKIEAAKAYNKDLACDMEKCWELIRLANEPNVLDKDTPYILDKCGRMTFEHPVYGKVQLLADDELNSLKVKKGSLTSEERREIESHVLHTYNYLTKIPWPENLKEIPDVACMHHEKNDGSGYPFGLKGEKTNILGKVMGISDIYDALTAKDRPYKKAVPEEKALQILKEESEKGKLDKKLVAFFVEKEIYSALQEE